MRGSAEIRREFLDFFTARGHALVPSSSLIPPDDPSLIFTSAGMVPFKPYFLGLKSGLPRAVSCQKCLRTVDIERVGDTLRHHTFFEMLGNFSFGDYFKKEAIAWAWEFLTRKMLLSRERLHPTVFKDDDEALALWKALKPANEVLRMGEDTNFWTMGPTGPCGPCSEIYYDLGPSYGCGKPECAPGCECDRYLEIWNLVFTQFDRGADGSLKPLPRKNIDTGMGLERLAFVLRAQGLRDAGSEEKTSPFETDLFAPIAGEIAALARSSDSPRKEAAAEAFARQEGKSERLVVDHAKAAVFLASVGVVPSNLGRGYVLRRLIRRALRHGRLLGLKGTFLHRLVAAVSGIYGAVYPELLKESSHAGRAIREEEEKFLETVEVGEGKLSEILSRVGRGGVLPGAEAFQLYETWGFPLELTVEICAEKGIRVDQKGFDLAREAAANVARASWKGSSGVAASGKLSLASLSARLAKTESAFVGYESLSVKTKVAAFEPFGEEWILVLEKTPFYPEGGGQVGDQGRILSEDGRTLLAEVLDAQKEGAAILHVVRPSPGAAIKEGLAVAAVVDAERRDLIRPHHTATHLLNAALRRVLGDHVRQAGSYVGSDKLRFDFTHPRALGPENLSRVSGLVMEQIRGGFPVVTRVLSLQKAMELGALSLAGENYGENPRTIAIGEGGIEAPLEKRFSLELCGGTHVQNTAQIKTFKIIKESSAASGIRRIEAVAGRAAEEFARKSAEGEEESLRALRARETELLAQIAGLGGKASALRREATVEELRSQERDLKSHLSRLREGRAIRDLEARKKVEDLGGVNFLSEKLDGADPKSLRGLSDRLKSEIGSGIVFLAADLNGKLSFVLALAGDLGGRDLDAAQLSKAFAAKRGGSAGGRRDFAQGGVPAGPWEDLVAELSDLIRNRLK